MRTCSTVFFEKRERELFRELIRLNGVGPKLALALMSGLEVDELVRCVQAQDTSVLVKIPGVGKKTAERLLVQGVGGRSWLLTAGGGTSQRWCSLKRGR